MPRIYPSEHNKFGARSLAISQRTILDELHTLLQENGLGYVDDLYLYTYDVEHISATMFTYPLVEIPFKLKSPYHKQEELCEYLNTISGRYSQDLMKGMEQILSRLGDKETEVEIHRYPSRVSEKDAVHYPGIRADRHIGTIVSTKQYVPLDDNLDRKQLGTKDDKIYENYSIIFTPAKDVADVIEHRIEKEYKNTNNVFYRMTPSVLSKFIDYWAQK